MRSDREPSADRAADESARRAADVADTAAANASADAAPLAPRDASLDAPAAEPSVETPSEESRATPAEGMPPSDATSADESRGDGASSDVPLGMHHVLPSEPHDGVALPGDLVPPYETPPPPPPAFPDVVEVTELDWDALRAAVDPAPIRARMRETVERMEALLDRAGGPAMLFDDDRADANDRAIRVQMVDEDVPLWFVGDLHGDLLALEAALTVARPARNGDAHSGDVPRARLVFLGDLFDDGGYGVEVLLRVFELILEDPGSVCVVAGNHDEALGYDGARFTASVSPSDFAEMLNANLAHEWLVRAGKLAVRLFAQAPRALFFPDGLLVAHGGFPLADLHAELAERGDWNDPRCLTDFVWTRAHPRARKKMPNRSSRGSQFGHEDFAAFCAVATSLGRLVTHMVRGHDHVDERWAVYPAYASHPILTINALSRQLAREAFGPAERVPTAARWVPGALPQVHRLHVPHELIHATFPELAAGSEIAERADDATESDA